MLGFTDLAQKAAHMRRAKEQDAEGFAWRSGIGAAPSPLLLSEANALLTTIDV
jgi:hypothetical protein